jgi:hypothetical protein
MSENTCIAEAISFAPITPYQAQPESWLEAAGMTRGRYDEEMDILNDCFWGHIHPVLDMLNDLPETPELKILKSELNGIIRAPFVRPQNPMTMMQDMSRALVDVVEYYHNSRGKKAKPAKTIASDVDDLKEIVPQNVNQKRAMVLLVILKSKPNEALHTEDCKLILEGAEGSALDSKVVRRAMCALAEIYNPMIIYEKIAGSYRVRTNF